MHKGLGIYLYLIAMTLSFSAPSLHAAWDDYYDDGGFGYDGGFDNFGGGYNDAWGYQDGDVTPSAAKKNKKDEKKEKVGPKTLLDVFQEPLEEQKPSLATKKSSTEEDPVKKRQQQVEEKQRAYVHVMDRAIVALSNLEKQSQHTVFSSSFRERSLAFNPLTASVVAADGKVADTWPYFVAFFSQPGDKIREKLVAFLGRLEPYNAKIDAFVEKHAPEEHDVLSKEEDLPDLALEQDILVSTYERKKREAFSGKDAKKNKKSVRRVLRDKPTLVAHNFDKELAALIKEGTELIEEIAKLFADKTFTATVDKEIKELERINKASWGKPGYGSSWRSYGGYTPPAWGNRGGGYGGSGRGSSWGSSPYGGSYGSGSGWGGYGNNAYRGDHDGYGENQSHLFGDADQEAKKEDEKKDKEDKVSTELTSQEKSKFEAAKKAFIALMETYKKDLSKPKVARDKVFAKLANALPSAIKHVVALNEALAARPEDVQLKIKKTLYKDMYQPYVDIVLRAIPYALDKEKNADALQRLVQEMEMLNQGDVAFIADKARKDIVQGVLDHKTVVAAKASITRGSSDEPLIAKANDLIARARSCFPGGVLVGLDDITSSDVRAKGLDKDANKKDVTPEQQALDELAQRIADEKQYPDFFKLAYQLLDKVRKDAIELEKTLHISPFTNEAFIKINGIQRQFFEADPAKIFATAFQQIDELLKAIDDDNKREALAAWFYQSFIQTYVPMLTMQPSLLASSAIALRNKQLFNTFLKQRLAVFDSSPRFSTQLTRTLLVPKNMPENKANRYWLRSEFLALAVEVIKASETITGSEPHNFYMKLCALFNDTQNPRVTNDALLANLAAYKADILWIVELLKKEVAIIKIKADRERRLASLQDYEKRCGQFFGLMLVAKRLKDTDPAKASTNLQSVNLCKAVVKDLFCDVFHLDVRFNALPTPYVPIMYPTETVSVYRKTVTLLRERIQLIQEAIAHKDGDDPQPPADGEDYYAVSVKLGSLEIVLAALDQSLSAITVNKNSFAALDTLRLTCAGDPLRISNEFWRSLYGLIIPRDPTTEEQPFNDAVKIFVEPLQELFSSFSFDGLLGRP